MTTDRDACIAAVKAWRAAEKTYHEKFARYLSGSWSGEPLKEWPELITLEAREELRGLRKAADDAHTHCDKMCGKP